MPQFRFRGKLIFQEFVRDTQIFKFADKSRSRHLLAVVLISEDVKRGGPGPGVEGLRLCV